VARHTYAQAQQAYQALGAGQNLRIVDADSSEVILHELAAAAGATK
jgi:hypothetical protein